MGCFQGPQAVDVAIVLKEGNAVKESRHIKSQRLRWLVLTEEFLCTFQDSTKDKAKITEALPLRTLELTSDASMHSQGKFVIQSANRAFKFSDAKGGGQPWVDSILRAKDALLNPRPRARTSTFKEPVNVDARKSVSEADKVLKEIQKLPDDKLVDTLRKSGYNPEGLLSATPPPLDGDSKSSKWELVRHDMWKIRALAYFVARAANLMNMHDMEEEEFINNFKPAVTEDDFFDEKKFKQSIDEMETSVGELRAQMLKDRMELAKLMRELDDDAMLEKQD